jgi:bifunctional DNA-binding transcriptional regulator/antitoxin component of YhaV-PrlF toxin-antitoxin module
MAEMLQEVRHLRWRARFIKAIVRTDDGKIFKVKLDQAVRRELAKVQRTATALDHL